MSAINLAVVLSLTFISHALFGLSAKRMPRETFEDALKRSFYEDYLIQNKNQIEKKPIISFEQYTKLRTQHEKNDNTVIDNQKPIENLDFSQVTEVSEDELMQIFTYVRDSRFLNVDNRDRRLSWLYPDDGCFARASMAQYLRQKSMPLPSKIFIFGDLEVETPNSPSGFVKWWYHVTIAYRVNQTLYVIDPAIDPQKPLSLEEWSLKMVNNINGAQFSLCNGLAYNPKALCSGESPKSLDETIEAQKMYLKLEWKRVVKLNRNPEKELGDEPPWNQLMNYLNESSMTAFPFYFIK